MSLVLNVEILGEFKKLTTATKGAENSLNGLSQKATKIGSSIKRVIGAVGLTLGLRAIVGGFKDAIAAAEEAQTANARIDSIAKSMDEFGNRTEQVTKRIKDYAQELSLSVGIDDEVIKKTQAKLLTFRNLTKTSDVMGGSFDRATRAAIDMAAAGFGEATSNATQLGKALNDPIAGITALNRSGIQFTEDQKELIKTLVESGDVLTAQDLILKEIEAQVGGTAEATANATDKMDVAFKSVSESIGLVLLPIVESFSEWLIDVVPDIQNFFAELIDPTSEMGEKWAGMVAVLKIASDTFGDLLAVFGGGDAVFSAVIGFITVIAAGLGQLVFVLGRVAEGWSAIFEGDFGKAFTISSNFAKDYSAFVRSQNQALTPSNRTQPPGSNLTQMREGGITINVNNPNATAQDIVNALNKARKADGSLALR